MLRGQRSASVSTHRSALQTEGGFGQQEKSASANGALDIEGGLCSNAGNVHLATLFCLVHSFAVNLLRGRQGYDPINTRVSLGPTNSVCCASVHPGFCNPVKIKPLSGMLRVLVLTTQHLLN
jgi:hypothetical protein